MYVNPEVKKFFRNKVCLVLGGTGFMGLNLVKNLSQCGARVIVGKHDSSSFKSDYKTVRINILNKEDLSWLNNADYIFHLAGLSGIVESNQNPLTNLETNAVGLLNVLEYLRVHNTKAIVFYPSSQQVYGRASNLPIDEEQSKNPQNIYGAHKLLAENYLRIYQELYGIRSVVMRLPNPYGPNQNGKKSYGIIAKFIQQAVSHEAITIFGDGQQKRDFVYIDDVTEAILKVMSNPRCYGKVYNIGSLEPLSITQVATRVVKIIGSGKIHFSPWPEAAMKADLGDIYLSGDKIYRDVGWRPTTTLEVGIKHSIAKSISERN